MNITYWTNFSKRTNSTKQPTGGTQTTVRLKEPCGISSPTFICSGVPDNVKYVQAFGRYYFVSEVTHNGGLIEISCTSDPLATYKSAIGALYADVEYTSASNNVLIRDPRNVPTDQIDESLSAVFDLTSYNFKLNPTTFIVSQRCASVSHADKIVVLDDGHVAGIGSHSELLKTNEVYREIYNSQVKSEEGVTDELSDESEVFE